MAELHKKERAQAQQIFQLKQELERAKLQLDASQREKSELASRLRKQRSAAEASAAAPADELGMLPRIPREGRPSCSRGSSDGVASRTGSASSTRKERRQSGELALPRGTLPAVDASDAATTPRNAAPHPAPSAAACTRSTTSAGHDVDARVRELEDALASERASSAALNSSLEHTRGELARLSARYEARLSSSTSLQHSLEARLDEAHAEIEAAHTQIGTLEAAVRSAKDEGERRARTPDEVHALRSENAKLRQEVGGLRRDLEAVGGRIKVLSGQADATSAEERSFLRMLSSVQKEQLELEQADGEESAAHVVRRVRPQPTAPPQRRQQQPPPPQEQPPPPLPPQQQQQQKRGQHQPAAHHESMGRLASKPPRLKGQAPLAPAEAERDKGAELADASDEARAGGGIAGAGASGGALGSPRRTTQGARRPPPQREVMAALDPEAAERRNQIDLLRQRMKGLNAQAGTLAGLK